MLTWTEIDLDAILYNLRQIRNLVEPKGAKVLAVIKDNAYGHGSLEVAKTVENDNVIMFGVATVEEAIQLRQGGINKPILIFCCILPEQAELVVYYDLTQTVCDLNICYALSSSAMKIGKVAKVHIKVDTGMGRIGIHCDKVIELIEQINRIPNIKIEGIYTHFSASDIDQDYTLLQIDRFNSVLSCLKKNDIHISIKHSASSSAIINYPSSYYDIVRPGIALYGYLPFITDKIQLKPTLSFKTRIVYIKEVPSGTSISYGRTYITDKITKVATLAVGYGQGYNRKLSNQADVIIRGKRAKIIGTICMDQCLCDVTNIPEASIGDEVILIGTQGDQTITADELAKKI
ncbi:MAG: alanine racemase, partial [Candidatus Poribacteria bacterium]